MKKSNFIMTVNVNYDLDKVDKITFKFMQKYNDRSVIFTYPSDKAVRTEDNRIVLKWDAKTAFIFSSNGEIEMDTLIDLKDSDLNPETNIVSLKMDRTLFTLKEVEEFG